MHNYGVHLACSASHRLCQVNAAVIAISDVFRSHLDSYDNFWRAFSCASNEGLDDFIKNKKSNTQNRQTLASSTM